MRRVGAPQFLHPSSGAPSPGTLGLPRDPKARSPLCLPTWAATDVKVETGCRVGPSVPSLALHLPDSTPAGHAPPRRKKKGEDPARARISARRFILSCSPCWRLEALDRVGAGHRGPPSDAALSPPGSPRAFTTRQASAPHARRPATASSPFSHPHPPGWVPGPPAARRWRTPARDAARNTPPRPPRVPGAAAEQTRPAAGRPPRPPLHRSRAQGPFGSSPKPRQGGSARGGRPPAPPRSRETHPRQRRWPRAGRRAGSGAARTPWARRQPARPARARRAAPSRAAAAWGRGLSCARRVRRPAFRPASPSPPIPVPVPSEGRRRRCDTAPFPRHCPLRGPGGPAAGGLSLPAALQERPPRVFPDQIPQQP